MATLLQRAGATLSGSTSVAATFAGACTSGSTIVATLTWENGTYTLTSITDGVNAGSYTVDKTATTGASGTGNGSVAIASIANTSGSALTVTALVSSSTFGRLDIYEYSGTLTLDSTGSANDAGGNSAMSTSLTTTADNCAVLCGAIHYDNNGVTQDAGYTQRFNAAGFSAYASTEDIADAGSAGVKTLTFGSSGLKSYTIAAAAYSGAAAPTPPNLMGAICL